MSTNPYLKYCWEMGGATQSKFFKKYDDNGKLHCEDGPAEFNHDGINYYIHGKRHRVDGPAVITKYGHEVWCYNDIDISNKLFKFLKSQNLSRADITDDIMMLAILAD